MCQNKFTRQTKIKICKCEFTLSQFDVLSGAANDEWHDLRPAQTAQIVQCRRFRWRNRTKCIRKQCGKQTERFVSFIYFGWHKLDYRIECNRIRLTLLFAPENRNQCLHFTTTAERRSRKKMNVAFQQKKNCWTHQTMAGRTPVKRIKFCWLISWNASWQPRTHETKWYRSSDEIVLHCSADFILNVQTEWANHLISSARCSFLARFRHHLQHLLSATT